MNALRLAAWVVAALVAASTLAQAQDTTTLKKEMVGQWELSTTERSKTCVVTMKGEAAGQGFKLELEPACKAALPFTKGIVAWSVRGLDIVRMQDASGEAVIDFTEVEAGIFEGLRQGEGVYILQDLAAARSMAKSMDQMIGDWSMVRSNGQPVCALTLTNTEAGPDNFQVFLKPQMRRGHRAVQPHAMAARARSDHFDVEGRRRLAVRGRRQRAMAARSRYRRSPDHAASVGAAKCDLILRARHR
ncbi:hypothetical protein ACVWW7_003220 [Bradyrhizobium sp. LM6.9]